MSNVVILICMLALGAVITVGLLLFFMSVMAASDD